MFYLPYKRMTIFLLVMGVGLTVQAGRISVGREIPYPGSYDVQEPQFRGGEQGVATPPVVVPRDFRTRQTGHTLETPEVIGVTRHEVGAQEHVRVRFSNGTVTTFITGVTRIIRGESYRGVGWDGRDYIVQNTRTEARYRFGPLDEEDE